MRNFVKKALAVTLAAALCLSLTACYSENNAWSAKKGDETLPIGSYIFYLSSAYAEAAAKVPSDQEVLKADIDGVTGKEWAKNRAVDSLKSYFFLNEKAGGLTDEELETASATTDSLWTYYKTTLEEMGVAKESFNKASSIYNVLYEKVFDQVYGEGGEMEVSEDELKAYFTENYYSYEYFYASLTKTDDDGNSVDMDDDEKQDVKKKLDGYVDKVTIGDMTLEEAAADYAEQALGSADNSTYYAPSPTLKDNVGSEEIKAALETAKDGEVVLAETSTGYYVIHKFSITDKFAEIKDDEDQTHSILHSMKSDDFEEYVDEQGAKEEGVEINASALNTVSWGKLVTDDNKMGTAAAETSEDDVSSEAASEAASEAE